MSEQETKQCRHESFNNMVDDEGFPTWDYKTPCPDCGKIKNEIFEDPDDIDPTSRLSQQPHGKNTQYCNKCQMMIEPQTWGGQTGCPYHQRTNEEGEQMWDEFPDEDY